MSMKRQSKKRCSLAVVHFEPRATPGRVQWERAADSVTDKASCYQYSLQLQWHDDSWHGLGTLDKAIGNAVDAVKAAVP